MNIEEKYEYVRKIDEGAFGEVYEGMQKYTKEKVAIKLSKKIENQSVLINEVRVMLYFQKKSLPFPKIKAYGECSNEKDTNYLVMELLGPCLCYMNVHKEREMEKMNYMSLYVLEICKQILRIFNILHINKFVYQDVKPSNFVFGLGLKKDVVYLIDFGLVRKYKKRNGRMNDYVGTSTYMSIRQHGKLYTNYLDDLESLGYLFHYLCEGTLPWSDDEDLDVIVEKKKNFKSDYGNIDAYMRVVCKYQMMDENEWNLREVYSKLQRNVSIIDLF